MRPTASSPPLLTIPVQAGLLDRNSASLKRLDGKTSPIELQTWLETRLEFLPLPPNTDEINRGFIGRFDREQG